MYNIPVAARMWLLGVSQTLIETSHKVVVLKTTKGL